MKSDTQINNSKIPSHVGIIMDGNGRWAVSHGLPRNQGHLRGSKRIFEIIEAAKELHIPYITIYAFSTENWKRPKEEVDYLMSLPSKYFKKNLNKFIENNINVRFIGSSDHVSNNILDIIDLVESKTKDLNGINLIIAFNYGSREEIINAIKKMNMDNVDISKLDATLFNNYLYTKGIPDVDLIIRTSGEKRISNFLLWQASYSEFAFTNTLWPDFRRKEFIKIISEYTNRDRRYGGRNND